LHITSLLKSINFDYFSNLKLDKLFNIRRIEYLFFRIVHPESLGHRAPINAQYLIGICDATGHLEYDRRGHANFNGDSEVQHPNLLFSWSKLEEEKERFFANNKLRIHCEITTLEQDIENLVYL